MKQWRSQHHDHARVVARVPEADAVAESSGARVAQEGVVVLSVGSTQSSDVGAAPPALPQHRQRKLHLTGEV